MARAIYRFPPGDPNDYFIDLRSDRDGPYWYHTRDEGEIFALIANRELNAGDTRYFAVGEGNPDMPGGPQLDALYERWPHVYRG